MTTSNSFEQNRKTNLKRLAIWTISWTLSQALVTFGGLIFWPNSSVVIALTILINIILGIGVIHSNRAYLLHGDELEKKIALESMSITLGLCIVFGLAYASLSQTKLLPFKADINHLVIFTGISYLITMRINKKRYE